MLARTRRNAVDDRDARHLPGAVAVVDHLAYGEDGMHEGRYEEPDCELARLVAQDALDDARGELSHCELHDDHRDREHQRGQADHRRCDGGQDHRRGIGSTDQTRRKRFVAEVAVERDRRERENRPGETHMTGTNQRLALRWMSSLESLT